MNFTNVCGHFQVSIFIHVHVTNSFCMSEHRNSFTFSLDTLNHFTRASRNNQVNILLQLKEIVNIFSGTNLLTERNNLFHYYEEKHVFSN